MLDFATKDLLLAMGHHLLIFALAAVLVFEIAVIRADLSAADIRRAGKVDLWYGIIAALILAVGFTRAVYAAKGWAYYSVNAFFWAKIGTFAVIGLLSVVPTVALIRWRRALTDDPAFMPAPAAIANVRRFMWMEAGLFALLPLFAAAMARGYGMPS
ncbi:MAG: DUF2214 family protein [Rhizomicrobium sp.]